MPEKPKSTAPGGESPKESIIGYPAPDSESPGAELDTKPEKETSGERLSRVSAELGRLATGRPFYESKTGNSQTPESPKLPEQPKPPADERQRLRAVLREAGKLNSEPELSTREDVLAALRGATTEASRPVPKPQTREEVLAALRGERPSPAAEETDSDGDSSVADTESESPAPENQEEPENLNEQDSDESPEVSDKQPPSASEALKALAEADDTRICIRNMSDAAETIVGTLKKTEIPLSSNNVQELASGVSTMLNRLNSAVEEARSGLPLGEAARLNDVIGEIRHALIVMDNAVAEQRRPGRSNNEDYLPYAMRLGDSIADLQRFMERISRAPRKQGARPIAAPR